MATNTFLDEGYVKYNCHWKETDCIDKASVKTLNKWRNKLYDLKLIGYYSQHKVGYGNISERYNQSKQFIISGTQTGNLKFLDVAHYSLVTSYDIDKNALFCEGQIKASSESLTHAIIYDLSQRYNAVIHIHNRKLWEKLKNKIPTTNKNVPYGTPEMANEIFRLYHNSNLSKEKILIMGGHEEGLVSFGENLDEAGEIILKLVETNSIKK